ncbi:PREDICTED: reverse mRNAase [Prunus dulcis]|uniref:PREDICTED: reverse mRNAase n=1 Tax=Prunus dulcis TaxID=3755 RepID=A0A5E4G4L8_PRUDU|nr:hypothetical protein L3X38_004450 [Prunus dulcis]VVA34745.1 PREDICTED: reverse mRNAase [Prunus dulcis]
MKNHEKHQSKSRQRKILGDITNKGKGQHDNSASGPIKTNNLAAPAGLYIKKPITKPRAPKKTHLSNGYQVRSLDIQEENSGGLSSIVSKYLSAAGTDGSSVFKPAAISGHDHPNINQSTAPTRGRDHPSTNSSNQVNMVIPNETTVSHLPQIVTIKTGRLQKAMIDGKSGVVGSTSALVKSIWTYLDGVSDAAKLPWLVVGDFNEINVDFEKKGGRPTQSQTGFAVWISRNHLMDLGFSKEEFTWCLMDLGFSTGEFTWCKKNDHGGTIWERLDRGPCSIDWRQTFPEAYVRHLPRINSDHCPLLISMNSAQ